jgi:hypothetical protein
MGMDIHQIIELWTGLSPHLAQVVPGQELIRDEYTAEVCRGEIDEGDQPTRQVTCREDSI